MTARPPLPPTGAFSDEERDLAARLSRIDAAAGPPSALDARILGAARAAAAAPRRARRWPGAFGAAAVLVAAVGLAWQLRPMFQLPPPSMENAEHSGDTGRAGVSRETVVQIETVPRAPAAVAPAGDQAAASAPAQAPRKATSVAGGTDAPRTAARPAAAARARAPEFVDEALPVADAAAPAPAPPMPTAVAAPSPPSQNSLRAAAEPQAKAAAATAERAPPPADVEADTHLAARAWLARIRERRDAGDLAGARESLARFVATHRNTRVPADLRPLLHDDDPWSP